MNVSFAKVSIPQKAVEIKLHKAAEAYSKYMEKLNGAPTEKLTFLQKRELGNFRTAKAMLDGSASSPVLNVKV